MDLSNSNDSSVAGGAPGRSGDPPTDYHGESSILFTVRAETPLPAAARAPRRPVTEMLHIGDWMNALGSPAAAPPDLPAAPSEPPARPRAPVLSAVAAFFVTAALISIQLATVVARSATITSYAMTGRCPQASPAPMEAAAPRPHPAEAEPAEAAAAAPPPVSSAAPEALHVPEEDAKPRVPATLTPARRPLRPFSASAATAALAEAARRCTGGRPAPGVRVVATFQPDGTATDAAVGGIGGATARCLKEAAASARVDAFSGAPSRASLRLW